MADQAGRGGIRFDPTISITSIVGTISLLIVMVSGWQALDKRVTINESEISELKRTDTRHEQDMKESMAVIRETMKSINDKIDRLQDREIRGGTRR